MAIAEPMKVNISHAQAPSTQAKDRSRYELQFFKTKQCSFYEKGKCTRGDKCKYAHGNGEMQARPDLTYTSLCRKWSSMGFCDDPNCSFAHNPDQLRATNKFYKTSLCKFHLLGRCRLGEECRHAHGDFELQPAPEVPQALQAESKGKRAARGDKKKGGGGAAAAEVGPSLQELLNKFSAPKGLHMPVMGQADPEPAGWSAGYYSSMMPPVQAPMKFASSWHQPAFIPPPGLEEDKHFTTTLGNPMLSASSLDDAWARLLPVDLMAAAPTCDSLADEIRGLAGGSFESTSSSSSNPDLQEDADIEARDGLVWRM